MASIFGKKKVDDESGSTDKPLVDSKGPQKMAEPSRVETIIGPGATIKGEINTRGTVRVDGNVEGKVNADGSIIVGEKGVVNAEITAGLVVIGGTVHGKVKGREKVEILSTGRLQGDVTTKPAKFVVAEGVIFEGRCTMGQAEPAKQQTLPKTKPPEEEKKEAGAASKT